MTRIFSASIYPAEFPAGQRTRKRSFRPGPAGTTYLAPTSQTFEIIADSNFNATSNTARSFTVVINPTDAGVNASGSGGTLINATLGTTGAAAEPAISQLPGQYLIASIVNNNNTNLGTAFPFGLDGRWLNAFNGPGMGAKAVHANFRYNGISPNSLGMDEDYDACDLENWFLAIQSADGQLSIPSFHRPGIVRFDPNNPNNPANDWSAIGTVPGFSQGN